MEYKTIIEEILEVYNINASDFAQKIDVQRSSISHILSGRNKPSLDLLIKVKEAFPELRWDYLLLGEKPMTSTEKAQIEQAQLNIENDLFPLPSTSPTPSVKEDKTVEHGKSIEEVNAKVNSTKKLKQIVWFYDDNTFQVFKNMD